MIRRPSASGSLSGPGLVFTVVKGKPQASMQAANRVVAVVTA